MLVSPFEKPALRPPAGHPRLLLTRRDLPRIRENLRRPENTAAVEIYERLLALPLTGKGATPEYGTYSLNSTHFLISSLI